MKFLIGLILIVFLVSSSVPNFVDATHQSESEREAYCINNASNEEYFECVDRGTWETHHLTDMQGWIAGIVILIIIVGVAIAIKKAKSSPTYSDNTDHSYTNVPRRGWTPNEQRQVRIRQDGKCAHCGDPPPRWHYHHVDGNRSNNRMNNCEALCPNCHEVETHEG
jgi:hypothetical protein